MKERKKFTVARCNFIEVFVNHWVNSLCAKLDNLPASMHGDGFVGFGLLDLWYKRRPLLSLETSRVAFRQIRSRHSLKDSGGISFSWPRPTFEHLNALPGHRQGLFPTGNLVMTLKKGPQLIFLRCCTTICAVKIPDVTQRYFTRNCLCPNNNGIVPCF